MVETGVRWSRFKEGDSKAIRMKKGRWETQGRARGNKRKAR